MIFQMILQTDCLLMNWKIKAGKFYDSLEKFLQFCMFSRKLDICKAVIGFSATLCMELCQNLSF